MHDKDLQSKHGQNNFLMKKLPCYFSIDEYNYIWEQLTAEADNVE